QGKTENSRNDSLRRVNAAWPSRKLQTPPVIGLLGEKEFHKIPSVVEHRLHLRKRSRTPSSPFADAGPGHCGPTRALLCRAARDRPRVLLSPPARCPARDATRETARSAHPAAHAQRDHAAI